MSRRANGSSTPNNALDTQWRYLTVAVNVLEETIEADSHSSRIVLLDSQNYYCDIDGRHGVWPNLDILASGEEQYTYITDSFSCEGAYWTQAGNTLSAPIRKCRFRPSCPDLSVHFRLDGRKRQVY